MIVGESSLQSYLIVDKHVIDEIDFVDIPFALMAAFFVYICYPKRCTNFYTFLEIVVLKYSAEKAPPSVKFLLRSVLIRTILHVLWHFACMVEFVL